MVKELMFKPLYSIEYINENGINNVYPELELVGEKAYGLSCIPKLWTLPFIVVSEKLLNLFKDSSDNYEKMEIISSWSEKIVSAALSVGIMEHDNIIVRSSGFTEGMDERGKYYSVDGILINIVKPLYKCLTDLSNDKSLKKQNIPLIIQKYATPISAKGHLSNERRCYEKRDWLGEIEDIKNKVAPFKIKMPLRKWRKEMVINERFTEEPLKCSLSAHISEILRIPATWAYERKMRVHFEWVWNGNNVFIVQADRENELQGTDPTKIFSSNSPIPPTFLPKCLKVMDETHSLRFKKIHNVFTYHKLGLPTTKLYVLDDQNVINMLACGNVPQDLEDDIKELVKGSLVIRMDISTEDKFERQLLPRTQEEREANSALNWLKEKSFTIRKETDADLVFIFHNFIPAVSSAFAYAAPGERKVQIEALWGLPEGLYYNAHDKFIVDTQTPNIQELSTKDFVITDKRNYKRFFISPDEDGKWTPKKLLPPYDWQRSIKKTDWIKQIALESRRIAEEEKMPLSIMWFVGVSKHSCQRAIFPWHHEFYDSNITSRAKVFRTKTSFDKTLIIKTNNDVEMLEHEAQKPYSNIRRIMIQPCEDILLREKSTLSKIGKLAHKLDAVILLEGGVLSHAYYQLMQTDAMVEILHPFEDEYKREFNKLVRDKVSSNIEKGGEVVSYTKLTGEYLFKALREKLIEEAFEVLDAVDQDSILGELADVNEVIDGILTHIGITRVELERRQKQKRDKAGGFKDGIVLLETRNPLPTKKIANNESLFLDLHTEENQERQLDERMIVEQSHKIDKWTDKREHQTNIESIVNVVIPMVLDSWFVNAPKTININSDNSLKIELKGKRIGAKYKIELSVSNDNIKDIQLSLFD